MPRTKKSKLDVSYWAFGDGRVIKKTFAKQCEFVGILMSGQCQGVSGHSGLHWSYRPDGSLAWRVNDKDPPNPDLKNIAGGWTPPDHKDYISPSEKVKEFWLNFSTEEELTDLKEIKRILAGKLKDGESLSQPCTDEEINVLMDRLDE